MRRPRDALVRPAGARTMRACADIVVVTNADLEPHVADVAEERGTRRDPYGPARTAARNGSCRSDRARRPRAAARVVVLVLNGDMPLDRRIARRATRSSHDARPRARDRADAAAVERSAGSCATASGSSRIVEQRDATADELEIDEMNAGLYAFDEAKLRAADRRTEATTTPRARILSHRHDRDARARRRPRSCPIVAEKSPFGARRERPRRTRSRKCAAQRSGCASTTCARA